MIACHWSNLPNRHNVKLASGVYPNKLAGGVAVGSIYVTVAELNLVSLFACWWGALSADGLETGRGDWIGWQAHE
jgi:hypothetical protein